MWQCNQRARCRVGTSARTPTITATCGKRASKDPDRSSHGALPTATAGSSLWAPQDLTKSRRDGRKTPRRGQVREPLPRRPRRQLAEADLRRSATCRSSRTTGSARQGRKAQRTARHTETGSRASCWPRSASRWCTPLPANSERVVYVLSVGFPFFLGRSSLRNLSAMCSPQPAPVTLQGGPMPPSPRHRASCDRQEARAGIVFLLSWCLVRLSNGGSGPLEETALSSPACTQPSRPDSLVPSGDERGRSKAFVFHCALQGIYRRFQLLQSREPLRAWSQIFTLRCDTATVAWLCFAERYVPDLTAYCRPPHWGPNVALRAFAVPKDVGHDRFIGDRCPCCPRLRRTFSPRSETAQFAFRDTKDCFYLYGIRPSCGAKQVIGPRMPRISLAHCYDENLDGVDHGIESWISHELLLACISTEPVSGNTFLKVVLSMTRVSGLERELGGGS